VSLQGGSGIPVPDDLVLVAHVSGPFGIAGWIRLRTYSSEASALLSAKSWWLDKPEMHDVEVLQVRAQGEDLVAHLMGIEGREAAENLQGATVHVRRAHFPALETNEFYWVDLIGHQVENLSGEQLGEVVGLMDNGAHPILRVASPAGAEPRTQELLIPFVDQFVASVDQSGKKITVDWERDY
jgi:16S rRNA processing protein RimM